MDKFIVSLQMDKLILSQRMNKWFQQVTEEQKSNQSSFEGHNQSSAGGHRRPSRAIQRTYLHNRIASSASHPYTLHYYQLMGATMWKRCGSDVEATWKRRESNVEARGNQRQGESDHN